MKRIISVFLPLFISSCLSLSVFAANEVTDHITVIVPPMATPMPTLTPVDIQTNDIDGETRRIVKIYNVPLDLEFEPLIPTTFDENGITYSRTDLSAEDIVVTDTKDVTVDKTTSNSSKIGVSAFADSLEYDQDEYKGALTRNDSSFSVWSNGTKQVSKTVTETKKYSGMPSNDMGQIAKSHNGLTLTNVDWYDQGGSSVKGYSDGTPRSYSATANYSGVQTSTVSTGYTAKVAYTGSVIKETVTGREVRVTYTVKIPLEVEITEAMEAEAEAEPTADAETEATESTENPSAFPIPLPIISIAVLCTAGLLELIHLIARKIKKS